MKYRCVCASLGLVPLAVLIVCFISPNNQANAATATYSKIGGNNINFMDPKTIQAAISRDTLQHAWDYELQSGTRTKSATPTIDKLDASDVKTLRQLYIIHRHGDRTNSDFSDFEPWAGSPFFDVYGAGQLTKRGVARAHLLGKLVRERYDKFLNSSRNEIKLGLESRSSGAPRVMETAESFLSSFMGLDEKRDSDIVWDKPNESPLAKLWQPIAVKSMTTSYDGMLAEPSCPTTEHNTDSELKNARKELVKKNRDLVDILMKEYGYSEEKITNEFHYVYDRLNIVASYFGKESLRPKTLANFDRIRQVAAESTRLVQSAKATRKTHGGMLVNYMADKMDKFVDTAEKDPSAKKQNYVNHFATHDIVVFGTLGILGGQKLADMQPMLDIPHFTATLLIELHKLDDPKITQPDDKYFVKIYYMPVVPGPMTPIHANDKGFVKCTDPKAACQHELLTLKKFKTLIEADRVAKWHDWMKICGVELEKMNPYS